MVLPDSGFTQLYVGVRGQTGVALIDSIKVEQTTGTGTTTPTNPGTTTPPTNPGGLGQPGSVVVPAPANTSPGNSLAISTATAPLSLVPGASLNDYSNLKGVFGRTQFFAKCLGVTPANPSDPFRAGRAIAEQIKSVAATVNVDQWNIPSYIVDTRKPEGPIAAGGGGYYWHDVKYSAEWGHQWDVSLEGVKYNSYGLRMPMPIGFKPSNGGLPIYGYYDPARPQLGYRGDMAAEIYDVGRDVLYGGWQWRNLTGNQWDVSVLARSTGVRTGKGQFSSGRVEHGTYEWGTVVASGLMGTPMMLGIKEMQAGMADPTKCYINHAVGLEMPYGQGAWNVYSWPAKNSDARNSDASAGLYQGSRIYLDPTYDIINSGKDNWTKALLWNLKTYGWIITDTSGAVAIRGEQYRGTGTNPWNSIVPPEWTGNYPRGALSQIPWDRIQVTPKDWKGTPDA